MKTDKELDVDFIGEQRSLTKEEERELSDFFEKRKKALKEHRKSSRKPSGRKKATA